MNWSYDSLARVYATDMGTSMPFDDIGWYARQCAGRLTLELGCGTGRILLSLLAAGIDAIGFDRSLPMLDELRRQAAERGLDAVVAQADLAALPLTGRFDMILAPYALITYVSDPDALSALLADLRNRLNPEGRLIVDSFVPQAVVAFDDFRLDYRRAHHDGWLERRKRITPLSDGRNRIEREYRLLAADDAVIEQWSTCEEIRPYTEAQVRERATAVGLNVIDRADDYGQARPGQGARFWSLILGAD